MPAGPTLKILSKNKISCQYIRIVWRFYLKFGFYDITGMIKHWIMFGQAGGGHMWPPLTSASGGPPVAPNGVPPGFNR